MGLIEDYVEYTEKYQKLYQKSAVLYQCGGFFEIYGYENKGADVKKIAKIFEIQSTKKNKSIEKISKSNPEMAGVPCYVIDKYIDLLVDNGYTVILVEQVTPAPNPKREVTKIISSGTKDSELNIYNNYLMSIYFSVSKSLKTSQPFVIASISYIDINTNNSYIFETTQNDTDLNMEDILQIITSNNPSEIIIFTDLETKKFSKEIDIINTFVNSLSVKTIHNKLDDIIKNDFFKNSYQTAFLNKIFKNIGILSVIEYLDLENRPLSLINYVFLLQFCYDHSAHILEGLNKPVFLDNIKYLELINNVLNNLNITSKDSNKTSSIINLLNNCKTSIGKRYFVNSLLHPITNINIIQKRYDMVDIFSKDKIYINCRKELENISDLDKLFKKICTKNFQPHQLISLDNSLKSIINLNNILKENNFIFSNLGWSTENEEDIINFYDYIQETFDIENIPNFNINQYTKNIFKEDVYPEIDHIQNELYLLENIFENVCLSLNEGNENNNDFKIELNKGKNKDKIIRSIVVTKNRFETLMKDKKRSEIVDELLRKNCNLALNDITTQSYSASNKTTLKIIFKNMADNQLNLIEKQNELKEMIFNTYLEELVIIRDKFNELFSISTKFIAEIDFYCNNTKNAIENSYYKPTIVDSEKSYIKAKKIRHPLIEKIQSDIPYVANDIEIGTEENKGILLYGINSVGKSSLMKSIGINLIMAQAGLFVACKEFEYSPYNYIFSRMPSGDNIFKGNSTYVSEIKELRTILKRSDNHSLIIGDEIASGTEQTSAISIIASSLNYLYNKNASFVFATHIHELYNLDCIKQLKNLNIYHLSVKFDSETNSLIFDRTLKKGAGNTLYGLEIAKSLDLPSDFLLFAEQVRKIHTNTNLDFLNTKKSTYNQNVFYDVCYICNEKTEEIHHIQEQCLANENGIILENDISKNRKSNLINVCAICHDKIHNKEIKINGFVQTSNGIKLEIEKEKQPDGNFENILKNRIIELRKKSYSYNNIHKIVNDEFKNENTTLYKIKKIISLI
jgi:DNA mismatch repair protein MutS